MSSKSTKHRNNKHMKKTKKSKHTKKTKQRGGGGYGVTMESLAKDVGMGYSGAVKYNHCGGGPSSLTNDNVIFNNSHGYGFTGGNGPIIPGSYAPVSRYVASQCGAGKKNKKGKKSKKGKTSKNKTLKSRKMMKRSKSAKKRSKLHHKKKGKKHGKKRKTMKKHQQKGGSGYSAYQSNTPIGASYESPNVTPPHNALGPLGINKTNVNCIDNYNHFKK